MRLEERRTLIVVLVAGSVGAVLLLPSLYFLGLWLVPERPQPAPTGSTPPLVRKALWARADGGPTTELQPVTAVGLVRMRICRVLAARHDSPDARGKARSECLHHMPGIQLADRLTGVHVEDLGVQGGLREGLGQVANAAWVTRHWNANTLMDTLAVRDRYGFGWRGIDAASAGYFGRPSAELTADQAAFLAVMIGEERLDPWCSPMEATTMRNRILERMHANGALTAAELRAAFDRPLGLAPPPEGRPPCKTS